MSSDIDQPTPPAPPARQALTTGGLGDTVKFPVASGPDPAPGGPARYNQLSRAINNKPFQCSDGCDSRQRRRSAARVEQA